MFDIFTSSQKKAVLFIMVFFSLAVGYHWINRFLHPKEPYDFSQFEEKFYTRYDSIRQVLKEDSMKQALAAADSTNIHEKLSELDGSEKAGSYSNPKDLKISPQSNTDRPPELININTATIEELKVLPRIGPKLAARIVEYRNRHGNFTVKKDLINVRGIGAKTFENLRHLITVD